MMILVVIKPPNSKMIVIYLMVSLELVKIKKNVEFIISIIILVKILNLNFI